MKQIGTSAVTLIVAAGLLSCSDYPVEPTSQLYPSYFLSRVDDQLLPVEYSGDGTLLLASGLGFAGGQRPRLGGPGAGLVNYTLILQPPDQSAQHSTVQLQYTVANDVLRINLCPPLALCVTSTELVGPILGPYDELELTHYLGGVPGSVYRYFPSLPD